MKKVLQVTLLLLTLLTQAQNTTIWNSKRDKIKIPFQMANNLIIVNVIFNGIHLKMIADTGASKSIIFSVPQNDSIEIKKAKLITISGPGINEKVQGYLSHQNQLQVGNYIDKNFEAIFVFDREINFVNRLGIPVNGILGSSFFKNYLVEIDYERRKIILHKTKKILRNTDRFDKTNVDFINERPYININSNLNSDEINLKLLFDTGLSDGLWLFENDNIKCGPQYIEDFLGKAISGDVYGKKSRVKSLAFKKNILENALVSYPVVSFFDKTNLAENRNGTLGGEVIKRFNWILDYESKIFYFVKNKFYDLPFNYNMSGIEVQHSGFQLVQEKVEQAFTTNVINVNKDVSAGNQSEFYKFELKPNFEIYALRKNSPAEKAGLLIGDVIVKINNKPSYKLTIQSVVDLFQSQEGKQITLLVERKGKYFTYKFQLEKVL
ncbi:PDZ domain-containing protein [Flavobacterium sp. HXWNR69]|uniref:PDZ domain-containing protein n=1 Tax=Flavobacterium fragile TaxID=2949085 RepID=A0ABT0TIM2_9FLAO|nr:PDZ domain-containing protein [Flavobacterium sp. HXWNR69]MCL9770809.1 PDZ domain-containing protein [Flavobacterium sp. HXWNR69]